MFQINQRISITNIEYHIAEHPSAPGMPYGQEGRKAIVYQLAGGDGYRALKVFKPRYRLPALASLKDKLAAFAQLPGLQVCARTVLVPQQHAALLRQYPDLTYAALMPWIEGPTWMEVVTEKRQIAPDASLALARALANILATMEQQGVAHCDLSAPNVLLPALAQSPTLRPRSGQVSNPQSPIELVDVEQLYAPGLDRPSDLASGTSGYTFATAGAELWATNGDRFAGAILIAEMLGWCDERVRVAAWGESYFQQDEIQHDSERYHLLVAVLRERWGDRVVEPLERAWHAQTLADCPTFGEWMVVLPEVQNEVRFESATATAPVVLDSLIARAQQLEAQGDHTNAIATYRATISRLTENDPLRKELELVVGGLEKRQVSSEELNRAAQEAERYVQVEQWQHAVTAYRTAIALARDSPRSIEWREALRRCEEEAELERLFVGGADSLRRGERTAARELLGEVIRRRPEYTRAGQRAATLYDQAAREEKTPSALPLLLAGIAAIILLLCLTAGGALIILPRLNPTAAPTSTIALATPSPIPTRAPTYIPPPTYAPLPTYTLLPTFTPFPTATRIPPTRIPSPTPAPTNTEIPTPTSLPCPAEFLTTPWNLPPQADTPQVKAFLMTWFGTSKTCIRRGECATVYWNVNPEPLFKYVENLVITLNGQVIGRQGSMEVCPSVTTNYTLDAQAKHWRVTTTGRIIVFP